MVDAWDPGHWDNIVNNTGTGSGDDQFAAAAAAAAAEVGTDAYGDYTVTLPSGAQWSVSTQAEVEFVTALTNQYAEQFGFDNISDLADLDKVVRNEFLLFRWESQLGSGVILEPTGPRPLSAGELDALAKRVENKSTENRQLKRQLQLDATSRSKTSGKGSPAAWFEGVLDAAERFGIHRNEQAALAIQLAMDLIGRAEFVQRASRTEQEIVGITETGVLEYIMGDFRDTFLKFAEKWEEEEQQYWVQDI